MRKRLTHAAGAFALFALAAVSAHAVRLVSAEAPTPPASGATPAPTPDGHQRVTAGQVGGVLFISSLKSDVRLDCTSLAVEARQVGSSQKLLSKVTAYGDITKTCRYYLGAVPAGVAFQIVVPEPQELKAKCDQHSFAADSTLPITLKPGERLRRDVTIRDISCAVVK
jgi:hypothetical protein